MASEHAKKLREVAAQLSTERFQGWSNPIVGVITDAADFIDGTVTADTGDAVLSRPAPAATDTAPKEDCKSDGLETVAFINSGDLAALPDTRNALVSSSQVSWDGQYDKDVALVTRSQAEELLADLHAAIAVKDHSLKLLEADNAAMDKLLKEANHV
ncbi:hypothetical protein [Brucella intermedia]|uniref:hypothetical protein n=1 Tax=Brucella intermedia TaxID=94625 RepID=UPI0034CD3CCE